jgi:hypothetical protein
MTTKGSLHRLVDAIPDSGLDAAERALEPLADPMLLALARAEHRRGETIGHADGARQSYHFIDMIPVPLSLTSLLVCATAWAAGYRRRIMSRR